jgi:hypothetical protein
VLHYTRLGSIAGGKHTFLLGPLVSYKVIKVQDDQLMAKTSLLHWSLDDVSPSAVGVKENLGIRRNS